MKYSITTYDDKGNEIITRNYQFGGVLAGDGSNLDSILEDSFQYLEEQALDYKEEPKSEEQADEDEDNYIYGEHECETDNSAGNVDVDGVCLTCGKTDLI
jgi:hypothetical protein